MCVINAWKFVLPPFGFSCFAAESSNKITVAEQLQFHKSHDHTCMQGTTPCGCLFRVPCDVVVHAQGNTDSVIGVAYATGFTHVEFHFRKVELVAWFSSTQRRTPKLKTLRIKPDGENSGITANHSYLCHGTVQQSSPESSGIVACHVFPYPPKQLWHQDLLWLLVHT